MKSMKWLQKKLKCTYVMNTCWILKKKPTTTCQVEVLFQINLKAKPKLSIQAMPWAVFMVFIAGVDLNKKNKLKKGDYFTEQWKVNVCEILHRNVSCCLRGVRRNTVHGGEELLIYVPVYGSEDWQASRCIFLHVYVSGIAFHVSNTGFSDLGRFSKSLHFRISPKTAFFLSSPSGYFSAKAVGLFWKCLATINLLLLASFSPKIRHSHARQR